MPEPDSLASAEDIRESVIPPVWPEPSPLLYGRKASLGALRDSISEEDARDLSDADLQAIRADAIARWAQKTDAEYFRRALKELSDQINEPLAWQGHQTRTARRQWAIIIAAWILMAASIYVLLHWK